jgi:drug/metabolite transporter (DMT)-like permease
MLWKNTHMRAFAALGLVMLLWAGNSIVARAVRFDVPPFTLAFLRWLGASLVLAPFAIGPLRRDWRVLLASWRIMLLLGLLGIGAFNALLYSGLQYTTATNALLMQAAIPAAVLVLDRILFGVRSPGWQTVGVAFSIMGVVTIVFEGDPGRLFSLHFGFGDVLILTSVLVWAIYTVFLKRRPDVSAISFVAATFFLGVLAMAPFALWEMIQGQRIVWSGGAIGAIAYVAVLPSLISYFLYNWATGVVGPARAGQAITMMPLLGAFVSAALLGEALAPFHYAGMVLIVAGIGLSTLALRRPAR